MATSADLSPVYFANPAQLRAWLEAHHETERELLVGYHKKHTGHPTLSWPESVDEALCFGWIDGVRRRVDDERYCIRFTPRQARSNWSAVNVRRVAELVAQGRMTPAGQRAFDARTSDRTAIYSYDSTESAQLDEAQLAEIEANQAAAAFFGKQPPSYRKAVVHWILTAKRPETRVSRLATLIEDCADGRRVQQFTRR